MRSPVPAAGPWEAVRLRSEKMLPSGRAANGYGPPFPAGDMPAAEEPLCPGRLKDHRLYLTDSAGRETGYLSFSDDRLYYVIVPLFEQRRVLVRIRAAGDASLSPKKKSAGYRRLHLWLKLKKEEKDTHLPESLHMQISRLLDTYRSYRS